jgi:hypothetical protein
MAGIRLPRINICMSSSQERGRDPKNSAAIAPGLSPAIDICANENGGGYRRA